MSNALSGSLRDFGIGDIFQLIGQQHKSGVLEVSDGEREVVLRFSEGRIVNAAPVDPERPPLAWMLVRCGVVTAQLLRSCADQREPGVSLDKSLRQRGGIEAAVFRKIRDLLTRDTIFSLLRWRDGTFTFTSGPVRHRRPLKSLLEAEQVLTDGLRMVDEWNAFSASAPPPHAVFRGLGSPHDYRGSATADVSPDRVETERVLGCVDGRRPARQVIDLAQVGLFQGTRALIELRRSGWIEEVGDVDAAPQRNLRAPRGLETRQLTNALSAGILLVALALAWWPAGTPGSDAPLPLVRDPVGEAVAHLEAVRLRNALEAYRLATGRWPEDLAALHGLGLTFREGDPHYFAVRDGAPVVLAPEL